MIYKDNPDKLPIFLLAYIGDAVYELRVREHLLEAGFVKSKEIHREAVRYVNANTQARLLKLLEPQLKPEELDIARRGRNTKTGHIPKNIDMIVYRYSTALEALIGYLYLKEEKEILDKVFNVLFSSGEELFAKGEAATDAEGETD